LSLGKLDPCYAIIPARYHSSRFPGKVLADIKGRPMFWHVYHQAKKCALLKDVFLATDHQLIFDKAKALNVPVVLTSTKHKTGTDRLVEAAAKLKLNAKSIILNLQADEPLLKPQMLEQLLIPFTDPKVHVTTLARPISLTEAQSPHQVKVVLAQNNLALYFSRSIIPYPDNPEIKLWGHIGLYGYRYDLLQAFAKMPQTPLEKTEKLEQLRLLENNIAIYVSKTQERTIGVDTPEDLAKVKAIMEKNSN